MLVLLLRSALLGGWLTASAGGLSGTVELHFDDLAYEGLHLGQTTLLIESVLDDVVNVQFNSAKLTVGDQTFAPLTLSCEARWQLNELICSDGDLSLTHVELGRLRGRATFRYDFEHGLQHVAVSNVPLADGRVDVTIRHGADGWQGDLALHDVDLGAVQTLVNQLAEVPGFAGLAALEGRLSAVVAATGLDATPDIHADWTLHDLNYSGNSVFQDIGARGTLTALHRRENWQLAVDINVSDGEMYIVPPVEHTGTPPGIYIAVPATGLALSAEARVSTDMQRIGIDRLHYEHPGVLRFEAAGLLEPGTDNPLTTLTVHVPSGDAGAAFPVYLQPWLLDTIYNDLDVAGQAGLTLKLVNGRMTALALLLDGVTVKDNAERFALYELTTDLTVDEERIGYSRMRWQGVDLYRLHFGAGAIGVASDGLDLKVTEWQDVPVFDGLLRIDQLDISGLGTPDFHVNMAGSLLPMSLLMLTEALEWPPFGGTLGGEFSGLTYRQGDLEVTGELRVRMFDGEVGIRGLSVQDLLGRLPVLEAQVSVTDIDLERLTDTFAFGKITGSLNGRVADLRLENWQPVMFDAELSTLGDRRVRHRISQQALNNIGQIGGGLQGALSRGFLSFFDEYSYGDLGLSCRLARGYCELGGVREAEDGHYILTRGGLLPPWVEVRLVGTMVPWDTLIEGFRTIAAGDIVIE